MTSMSIVLTGNVRKPQYEANELFFYLESTRKYIGSDGQVKAITILPLVHYDRNDAEWISNRLVEGAKVGISGFMLGDGGPLITYESTTPRAWYEIQATQVSLLAPPLPDDGIVYDDVQQVILIGRLGKDPEMRFTQDGSTQFTSINLATNYSMKIGDKWEKFTTWWRLTIWGERAETLNRLLSKGKQVMVESTIMGDPKTGGPNIWIGNEGEPRASFEGTINSWKALEKLDSGGPQPQYEEPLRFQADEDIPL